MVRNSFIRTWSLLLGLCLAAPACERSVGLREYTDVSPFLPNDPLFRKLWAHKRIHSASGWAVTTDCTAKPVAVVDTGIDLTHPDLADNLWTNTGETAGNGVDDDGNGYIDDVHGWNFYDGNAEPVDDNLHGTHVAGTIGATGNNGVGLAGICWKARIMAVKVLGGVEGMGAMSDVATGIGYAVDNGAKIVNLSLGGPSNSAAMGSAIQYAQTKGVLVVAAAGNDSSDNDSIPTYPASLPYDNLVRVAAVGPDDQLADFSNYGAKSVDIAAPGVSILSTFPTYVTEAMSEAGKGSSYESLEGTSMATPHVAGAAALIWSKHPSDSYTDLRGALLAHGEAISSLDGKVAGSLRLSLAGGI
jgi:subtilisin family serine protease